MLCKFFNVDNCFEPTGTDSSSEAVVRVADLCPTLCASVLCRGELDPVDCARNTRADCTDTDVFSAEDLSRLQSQCPVTCDTCPLVTSTTGTSTVTSATTTIKPVSCNGQVDPAQCTAANKPFCTSSVTPNFRSECSLLCGTCNFSTVTSTTVTTASSTTISTSTTSTSITATAEAPEGRFCTSLRQLPADVPGGIEVGLQNPAGFCSRVVEEDGTETDRTRFRFGLCRPHETSGIAIGRLGEKDAACVPATAFRECPEGYILPSSGTVVKVQHCDLPLYSGRTQKECDEAGAACDDIKNVEDGTTAAAQWPSFCIGQLRSSDIQNTARPFCAAGPGSNATYAMISQDCNHLFAN